MTPPSSGLRVLVVRMSAFGDIICSLPLLRSLRDALPDAHIGWVIDSRFQELLADEPAIDALHVAPLSRWKKLTRNPLQWPGLLRERKAFRAELREARYDVCLDAMGILKSGLIARMSGAQRVVHMATGRIAGRTRAFPGERVTPRSPHAVDRFLCLASAVGGDIEHPRFDLHIPDAARAAGNALVDGHEFASSGPLVALNPGAAAPHRMWPAERFGQLARRLSERIGARILIVGGPREVELAEGIAREADVGALCTAGKTSLLELAAVLDRCDTLVTGDTGPQHVGYALGKHVVALFGPANPQSTGPYGPGHAVIQKPFPCQPCYAHPTCKDFPCMKAIEVEEVVEAVRAVLGA